MKISEGRVIFFDTLAQGLLQLLPLPDPFEMIALLFKDPNNLLGYDDRTNIAEALCRLCNNSSSHIPVIRFKDSQDSGLSQPFIFDACNKTTQEVIAAIKKKYSQYRGIIIFNYSENDNPCLPEVPFDLESEKYLIEEATRNLFKKAKLVYETLAPHRFIHNGGFSVFNSEYLIFEDTPKNNFNDPKKLKIFCHTVARNWTFEGIQINGDNVYNWVMQFSQAKLVNEACHLLLFLKREGFVTQPKIKENIRLVLNDHLKCIRDEPIYISIQPTGKSESLLSYYLRPQIKLLNIEEALSKAKKQSNTVQLICFDDVIVSGMSMLKYLFEPQFNKLSSELRNALEDRKLSITIISSHADINGITRIIKDPQCFGAVKVKAAKIVCDYYRVFSENSNIIPEKGKIKEFEKFCKEIGEKIRPSIPLGWNNAQWCIVLDYTVPNGTLPILWASSEKDNWQALFKRERTS